MCRQVFGFRLAVLALASPVALVRVGPGAAAWATGSAVVITFMGSYLLFRDWERFGPLLLRHPALLAVDSLFAAVLLTAGTVHSPLAYVTVCTPLLAGLVYGRRGALLFTALQIAVLGAVVALDGPGGRLDGVLLLPGFCVVAGVAGVTLRRLMLGFGEATRALTRTRARLAAAEAVAAERARLAREMHDSVAKTLHGVTLAAEALAACADRLDPAALRDRADLVARSARRAADESRALLAGLRRDPDDGPLERRLAGAVAEFTDRAGLPVVLVPPSGPLPELPAPVVRHLVAIVREALENAHRHAGAGHAEVAAAVVDGAVRITVRDDGRGLPAHATVADWRARGRFGVVGMVERAEAVGARITIGPARDRTGTEVRVDLPATTASRPSPSRRSP
nr:histidine kinase [Streptomyces sp. SID5468]